MNQGNTDQAPGKCNGAATAHENTKPPFLGFNNRNRRVFFALPLCGWNSYSSGLPSVIPWASIAALLSLPRAPRHKKAGHRL